MPFDFDRLGNLLLVYGTHFLGAVIVALIGWWMAGKVEGITRRALTSASRMDPTVGAFLSSLAYYAVLVVTLLVTLQALGIQATSIVAIVGVASLTIGLALQGTLSNIAAGIMLLIFRPFRLVDSIEVVGKSGTVKNLNLFMTELASDDNVQVLIPNGQVWSAPLINFSVYPTRRVSASFPVALDKDAQTITSRIRAYLEQDERVLKTPPPNIITSALTETVTEFSVQAWSKAEDASVVRADLMQRLLEATQMPSSATNCPE
jgi:small conductance mechanosensitive channel